MTEYHHIELYSERDELEDAIREKMEAYVKQGIIPPEVLVPDVPAPPVFKLPLPDIGFELPALPSLPSIKVSL